MEDILDIPGLREGIEREKNIWNIAFLPIPESIAGFEVMPMSLRHYLILSTMKSPLLYGGVPSPLELCAFLWVLNPHYHPKAKLRRFLFLRKCRSFLPKNDSLEELEKAAAVLKSAREYLDEVFFEKPGSKAANGRPPEYYSDAAGVCGTFAREFGWDDESTLNKPLKRIFQYLKAIGRFHSPNVPLFKPSDRITGDWIAARNKQN